MGRMVDFLGMTVGGWVGWAVGDRLSLFTAILLSIVGTGVGLYVAGAGWATTSERRPGDFGGEPSTRPAASAPGTGPPALRTVAR